MGEYEQAVFVSYAWGSEREEIVNQMDQALQKRGLKVIRDKRDLGYKGSISQFMERIGHGNCVIVVISDKYLRSPNCMFELVEIAENRQFYDRIFPVVLADADIYDPVKRLGYVKHWEIKRAELAEAMRTVDPANLQGIREDIDLYDRIRGKISSLASILKDMNTLTSEIHQDSDFSILYDAIEKRRNERQIQKSAMASDARKLSSTPPQENNTAEIGYIPEQVDNKLTLNSTPKPGIDVDFKKYINAWGEAPNISAFYGRQPELLTLTSWIMESVSPLVLIWGVGGTGKTYLATKLAHDLSNHFDYIIWLSLRNAPPIEYVLQRCFDNLFIEKPSQDTNIEDSIMFLVEKMQDSRCLVVLDNVEAVFDKENAGVYRDGYDAYSILFKAVLKQNKSSFLLTSREKIVEFENDDSPIKVLTLQGLSTQDGQVMLEKRGLSGTSDSLNKLVNGYSGNPLALSITAGLIKELYLGNIDDFLKEEIIIVGRIQDVLSEQFERLSQLEQDIMLWLAIERESVSREQLLRNIIPTQQKRSLLQALKSLRTRGLIENTPDGFTLQNVVMEYLVDRLIETICTEIETKKPNVLSTHALLKAQSKDFIRESQVRLIVEPILSTLKSKLAVQLDVLLQQVLGSVRNNKSDERGYAAGNILNLFCQGGFDITGSDFSDLHVSQAYLQGALLNKVNFSKSNFSDCVFTSSSGSTISLATDRNGDWLVAGSTNGNVYIWDFDKGTEIHILVGHKDWVRTVAVSSDGALLASGSTDKTVRIWDTKTGYCRQLINAHSNRVRQVLFDSTKSKLFSCSDDGTIKIWNTSSGECINTLMGHTGGVLSIVLSPDEQKLISGGRDGKIRVWDLESGQCINTFLAHESWIWCLTLDATGENLASGSEDGSIKVWRLETGDCIAFWESSSPVWNITFNDDGRFLLSSGDEPVIRMWDIKTTTCIRSFQGHVNRIRSSILSQDNQILISSSDDQTIKFWDVTTAQCIKTLQGFVDYVRSISLNEERHLIASGGDDQVVRLWDMLSGQCIRRMKGHSNWVWSVVLSHLQ